MTYRIRLTRAAKRTLERMLPRVVEVVVAFIYGPLADNPQRTGKLMRSPDEGLYVGRRGDYRVIYRILETTVDVQNLAIGHRSKIYAFRERLAQAFSAEVRRAPGIEANTAPSDDGEGVS